ncbi:hypothetical protein BOTNAR_0185g00060 [Botryotinia narcissicola]|uniref:Homeobox domain-containing protein n=1 Tax=Botryotinia narcissicola TaxID=278944 RepID=A0A4Z1IGE5_9HELO|nr:hypothetical protein BOTNAR_0185g00060 [Botryotinia narcissicola]
MTRKLGLQAFLRREVMKAKLQIPTENESPRFTKEAYILSAQPKICEEPERNTFRNIFGDNEEDYETPLEKLRNSNTPFAVRKQLLAVIDTSFKDPRERTISAKERDHLLRSIERLEAQEKREKDNALRATGNLPEPISEHEKRQQQKGLDLVKNALAGKEKAKPQIKRPFRPLDDDPDGETRKLLGLPLRRRKLKKTGKWADELRYVVPELRYKDYGIETLKGILLCGADEEQERWLGKWFGRLDVNATTGGRVRGSSKKRSISMLQSPIYRSDDILPVRSNGSECAMSVVNEASRMASVSSFAVKNNIAATFDTPETRILPKKRKSPEIKCRERVEEIKQRLTKPREEKLAAQLNGRVVGEKRNDLRPQKSLKAYYRIRSFLNITCSPEDSAMGKFKRWQSEEIAKLKEICSRQEHVDTRGKNNPFWENVADEMEGYGFDRQANAIYFKWMRLIQPTKMKSSKKGPSNHGDFSDTEDEERDKEEFEDYYGETDAKSDLLFQTESGEDASKPWATGSNWSDEEGDIAYQCIKSQRDKEKELKLEPITADQIWHIVAKALEQHQIYRKITNICYYWKNKGREKYNFDERTPDTIEKSSRGTVRVRGGKSAQNSPGHAARQTDPRHTISQSSTEEYFQNNSRAETAMGDTQIQVSSWQHDLLMIQYRKYNGLDNPVMNKLEEDTGLSREQIKLWYRNQRAIDAKEADVQREVKLQTEKELPTPILDGSEFQSMELKRYRVSDIGYHLQEEETPAKRVRHSLGPEILDKPETFGRRSIIPEPNEPSANDVTISTIEVQQPFLKPITQRNIPESTSDVATVMKANRELEQQKVNAAEEEYKQLELAIVAHKERADLELKAANAKERELKVQREIREKATKRIAMIESFLDDY